MNTRLFCLIIDPRGRDGVSCRDSDLDRVTPAEYFGNFSAAYAAARKSTIISPSEAGSCFAGVLTYLTLARQHISDAAGTRDL